LSLAGCGLAWHLVPRLPRDTSLEQLFPGAGEARQRFADFDAAFGTDDTLLVVVRDRGPQPVFNPQTLGFLDLVVERLQAAPGVEQVVSLVNLVDLVVVDPRLPPLAQTLVSPRRAAVDPGLRARLQADPLLGNGLLSADGNATACWVLLDPQLRRRPDYVPAVEAIAARVPAPGAGAPHLEVLATGFALLQGAALAAMTRDAAVLALAALVAVVAVALLGGVPWRAALGFTLSWPAVVGALAAWCHATGRPLHVFSSSVPPLLLITAGASFVHLGRALPRGAAAVRATLAACALATATTAVSFGSLAFSSLTPLAAVGAEVAVGAATAFALGTACVLAMAPPGERRPPPPPPADAADRLPPPAPPPAASPAATSAPTAAARRRRAACFAAPAVLAVPWFAADGGRLGRLGDFLRLLPSDHPRVLDAERAQELLGAPTAFEVVVAASRRQVQDPDFLLRLADFEAALVAAGGDALPFVLSPVTLLRALDKRLPPGVPASPTATTAGEPAGEAAPALEGAPAAGALRRGTAEYAVRHLIRPYLALLEAPAAAAGRLTAFTAAMRQLLSASGDRLRFGCRIPHLSPEGMQALIAVLQPVFRDFEQQLGSPRIYATGYAVLVAAAAAELRATLGASLLGGGAVLAILLLAVVQSLRLWALALAINALTAVSILNAMWLGGASLQPYSAVLTAALLGILIDNTVHLLLAVRRHRRQPNAVAAALREVAPPIALSSACLAAGFAAFALSDLPMYRQLAWTATAATALGLLWDLGVLPPALAAQLPRRRAPGSAP
jgi:predicted RND superfamily exporter protein